jgi:hypothetical protein
MAPEDAVRCRWFVVLFAAMSVSADAQWLNFVPPGTPKTADGKPDLRADTPRTADGKPDLSGTWMHELTSAAEMKRLFGAIIDEAIKVDVPGMEIGTQHKYAMNILLDSKPGEVSMTPEGAAVMKQRMAATDPSDVCRAVPGFPLAGLLSEPIKIVQAPKTTIVLYEAGSLHRQIFSDGRTFPQEFELPAFLGYSVGRWEGDVFVVETRGFNDKTPLDAIGHPHSESLHVTERFRRIDFGHLDVEMTFDDPRMYTKPFTVKIPHTLIADQDIFEMFCENERDSAHIKNAKQPR